MRTSAFASMILIAMTAGCDGGSGSWVDPADAADTWVEVRTVEDTPAPDDPQDVEADLDPDADSIDPWDTDVIPGPEDTEAPQDTTTEAWVEILSPTDGAELENPVKILFAAGADVAWVSVEVDDWLLHDGLLSADAGSLTYSFVGVGFERHMLLTGYDEDEQAIAWDEVVFTAVNPPLGFPIADNPGFFLSKFDGDGSSAEFGAPRSDGRLHAGCDLYWTHDGGWDYKNAYYTHNNNTKIYAVADGTIVAYYPFYNGTHALEVDHGEFTVRYGEVDDGGLPGDLGVGSQVIAGQKIGKMGDLAMSSGTWSMLHFEVYSNDLTGALTQTGNWDYMNVPDGKYQRRGDLMDCRPFLRGILEAQ